MLLVKWSFFNCQREFSLGSPLPFISSLQHTLPCTVLVHYLLQVFVKRALMEVGHFHLQQAPAELLCHTALLFFIVLTDTPSAGCPTSVHGSLSSIQISFCCMYANNQADWGTGLNKPQRDTPVLVRHDRLHAHAQTHTIMSWRQTTQSQMTEMRRLCACVCVCSPGAAVVCQPLVLAC